jgi:hypothetical protein
MAAPITHIVLANKIYEQKFPQQNKQEFFVGTSFPDIRYLGVIERDETHRGPESIEAIQGMSSFEAGVNFHQLVDNKREKYLQEHAVYDLVSNTDLIILAVKLLEDEIIYNNILDWQEYASFFTHALKQEIAYGIEQKDIQRWHKLLSSYISHKPNSESRKNLLLELGFSTESAKKINTTVQSLAENKKLVGIVNDFYNNFEEIIKK